ncbi:TPA: hypothetical protein ACXRX6_002095 [Klebsiella pneumoniae]
MMNNELIEAICKDILSKYKEEVEKNGSDIVLLAPIGLAISKRFKDKLPETFKLKDFIKRNLGEELSLLTNPTVKTYCAVIKKDKVMEAVDNDILNVDIEKKNYDTIYDFLINNLSYHEMKLINIPLNILQKKLSKKVN